MFNHPPCENNSDTNHYNFDRHAQSVGCIMDQDQILTECHFSQDDIRGDFALNPSKEEIMSKTIITPSMEQLTEALDRIAALELRVVQLEELTTKRDNRGPKSESTMTAEHAFRVKFGDLKDVKHGEAAKTLGLSYGQVFSCRGGYTFKTVDKNWKAPEAKVEAATTAE